MQPFEYAAPDTLEEAIGLLSDTWGETEIYAGGTDLVTCLKQGLTTPKRVVSLKNIEEMRYFGGGEGGDGRMNSWLSARINLAGAAQSWKHWGAMTDAIHAINSPQMLHFGTIGGELCQRPRCWFYRNGYGLFGEESGKSLVVDGDNRYHAIFGNEGRAKFVSASSLAPALIALNMTATIVGPDGERTISLAEFFRIPKEDGERETVLAPNEILTKITKEFSPETSATYEVRHRNGLDWPYVSASVALGTEPRVVLGHVAPIPWTVPAAAEVLKDGVTEASATKAGEIAAEGATPLSRNGYKVAMVKTAVKRAALLAASRA